MSATIIQFVPRPNPDREKNLERQAMEIANMAFPSVYGFAETAPYKGAGIDGMDCSQANAFHAPENDPA